MQETRVAVSIPGLGILLEDQVATHYTIFAWRVSWTEESGELQSMRPQRDTTEHTHTLVSGAAPFPARKWGPLPELWSLEKDSRHRARQGGPSMRRAPTEVKTHSRLTKLRPQMWPHPTQAAVLRATLLSQHPTGLLLRALVCGRIYVFKKFETYFRNTSPWLHISVRSMWPLCLRERLLWGLASRTLEASWSPAPVVNTQWSWEECCRRNLGQRWMGSFSSF